MNFAPDSKSWNHPGGPQYGLTQGSSGLPHHGGIGRDPSSEALGASDLDSEAGGEHLSYNQRNVKKWETDEPLGDMATISPVLYANLCHPELKTQYTGYFIKIINTEIYLWQHCFIIIMIGHLFAPAPFNCHSFTLTTELLLITYYIA